MVAVKNFDALLTECESHIREGHSQKASRILTALDLPSLTRAQRFSLAKICRRAGLLALGLKLLSPVALAEKNKIKLEPTPGELAEYAVLLQRSGALMEALEKLRKVDVRVAPEAMLYQAFTHFALWEYEAAIPILKSYLEADLPPYDRTVGQLNLAFALVEANKNEEALQVLEELLKSQSAQILSNSHALKGQLYIQSQCFSKAREQFEKARQLVSSTHTNDQFFAHKWRLILEGLEKRDITPFEELKRLARQNRSWEVCREADLYSIRVKYNRERFLHLYFGSPFEGFRHRLYEEFKEIPEQPIYVLGPKISPRMDLLNGRVNDQKVFNPGRKCHLLLDALLFDFYRPRRIANLFSHLFPGEYFNILTSPHRVHQLISRTRSEIQRKDLPLEISEEGGFYVLNCTEPFSFRIPRERRRITPGSLQFQKLKEVFSNVTPFSSKDVRHCLNLSPATAHRLVHQGLQEGVIESAGKSNGMMMFKMAS